MPAIRCTVSPPDQSRRVPFGYSEPLKQNLGLGAHYAVVDLFERVMSHIWLSLALAYVRDLQEPAGVGTIQTPVDVAFGTRASMGAVRS